MSKFYICVICGIVLFVGTACSVKPSIQYAYSDADNTGHAYVIFNPDHSPLPPEFVGRADWPVTFAHQSTGEIVEYRESITDNDSQFFGARDNYRRRFRSTRTGRQIR